MCARDTTWTKSTHLTYKKSRRQCQLINQGHIQSKAIPSTLSLTCKRISACLWTHSVVTTTLNGRLKLKRWSDLVKWVNDGYQTACENAFEVGVIFHYRGHFEDSRKKCQTTQLGISFQKENNYFSCLDTHFLLEIATLTLHHRLQ